MGSLTYLCYNRPGQKPPQAISVIYGRNLRQNGADWQIDLTPPATPPRRTTSSRRAASAAMWLRRFAKPRAALRKLTYFDRGPRS